MTEEAVLFFPVSWPLGSGALAPLQSTGLGEGGLGTSPKMPVHGEVTDVTAEVLPDGSGHNHWNSLEHG